MNDYVIRVGKPNVTEEDAQAMYNAVKGNFLGPGPYVEKFEQEFAKYLGVKNAVAVYNDLSKWNPISIKDFQEAHTQLMKDLIKSKGIWRKGGVDVFKDKQISHIAPPAKRVEKLMLDLLKLKKKLSSSINYPI